jgi:hypothetical protein
MRPLLRFPGDGQKHSHRGADEALAKRPGAASRAGRRARSSRRPAEAHRHSAAVDDAARKLAAWQGLRLTDRCTLAEIVLAADEVAAQDVRTSRTPHCRR